MRAVKGNLGHSLNRDMVNRKALDFGLLMQMDHLYLETLQNMEAWLRVFERLVPAPKLVSLGGQPALRYTEKTICQTIVQKLARLVSGLGAARVLLVHGYVQELGALQQMLDEFREDVIFLSLAVIYNDKTDLPVRYLEAFYQEEFDKPNDPVGSTQDRPTIPRKKVQAYIAKSEAAALDPSRSIQLSKTISKAYSGYVHGASPHIMEMYGGSPARFHVQGMLGTPRMEGHERDIWNVFYRGINAFGLGAKAFGVEDLLKNILAFRDYFESASGKDYPDTRRERT